MPDPVDNSVSNMVEEMLKQMQESTDASIRNNKKTMIMEMTTMRMRRATSSVFSMLGDNLMDIQAARNLRKELKMGAVETSSGPEWKSSEDVIADAPEVSKGGGDPLIAKYQGLADNLSAIITYLEGGGSVDDKMDAAGLEGFGAMTISEYLEAQDISTTDIDAMKEARDNAQEVADQIDEWMSSATNVSIEEFMDALADRADNLSPELIEELTEAYDHYNEMKDIQSTINVAPADSEMDALMYLVDPIINVENGAQIISYLESHGIEVDGMTIGELMTAINNEVDAAKARVDEIIEEHMDDSYVGGSSVMGTESAMQTASADLSAPNSPEDEDELDEILNEL